MAAIRRDGDNKMDDSNYTGFEWKLFEQGDLANREIELSYQQAEVLISSGFYRRSTGFPYAATQYRRSNADGSCLHLVWRKGRPRLHRDTFDPHGSPISLYMHLTNEARFESVATCALTWSLIKLLSR